MFIRNIAILAVLFVLFISIASAIIPSGATLTHIKNETAPADSPEGVAAIAGNVTELNIFGYSTTQSWQGYFGNVTGTIQLADANDNVMYNWSLASPQGEVYASTNSSITWSLVQCFNFTADGTYADDSAQAGATSLHGMNLTQLETLFGIDSSDVDGVDETFNLIGSGSHSTFYTAHREFDDSECQTTRVYDSSGAGTAGHFEEVLLYEPDTRSVVFTSLLNEDVLGFDNKAHDFEMLVLENGHNTDTDTTTYYFWVELE